MESGECRWGVVMHGVCFFRMKNLAAIGMAFVLGIPASALALTVPPGSTRVPMLEVTVTNDRMVSADLSELSVRHRGLGLAADIEHVYALLDGERVTTGASFQGRDPVAQLRFVPVLTLAGGERVTLKLFADFSDDAAITGEHRLETMPLEGFLLEARGPSDGATTAGPAEPSITVENLTVRERVRYGKARIVARFRLTNDGDDDQRITKITLVNDGKARGKDLQNLVITANRSTVLSETLPMLGGRGGDRAVFVFDPPLLLGAGDETTINVRADVLASRRKTIQFILEEPGDLEASVDRSRTR